MDQIQIVVSEPDRSEQRILTSIDASHISSYGVLSNKLYLTSNQFIYDTDEEGLIVETFQIASSVYCIDLETGKKLGSGIWERPIMAVWRSFVEILRISICNTAILSSPLMEKILKRHYTTP
ncbi:MAG: hypothetical protein Q4G61_05540 [Tissierellia bacterium]|nr:hypothetical protein [Tissierellia bacterium]